MPANGPTDVLDALDYVGLADRLEQAIVEQDWPDGHRLPSERALAEAYGVGRALVRRALLLLVSRGRILTRDRTRAVVTRTTQGETSRRLVDGHLRLLMDTPRAHEDFQEARTLFEVGLVRHAARHATAKQLSLLASALLENKRAVGDAAAFGRTDVAFHRVIAEMLDNPLVMLMHEAIARQMSIQHVHTLLPRGSMQAGYRNHVAVYDGIAAHDPDAAEQAIQTHLMVVGRSYIRSTRTGAG